MSPKLYGPVRAVDGVSISVPRGEFLTLLGPSGSGKTTLLMMIAGFQTPTAGAIFLDGRAITNLPPDKRHFGMVFQGYALFPHMTVAENVGFGLEVRRRPPAEIATRVAQALELVRLQAYGDCKPGQLSGGQQQRVALARALCFQPEVPLLDEPLGALDRKLRERTQFELVNLQERIGITFIMVTHDQEEAMTMSDRIAIMDKGKIHQVGAPRDVYEDPKSRFIADFIGAANLMAGQVESVKDGVATVRLSAADAVMTVPTELFLAEGDAVTVMVRPERITAWRDADTTAPGNTLTGIVSDIAYLGDLSIYHVQVSDGLKVQVAMANRHRSDHAPLTWDDAVTLSWYPGDGLVLTA